MAKITCYPVKLTIADESTAISSGAINISGRLVGVASTAGALDGSDTYEVKIVDSYGISVYQVSGKAESSTTVDFSSTYGVTESTALSIPMVGPVVVTITASAEQNDAAVEFTVFIYTEI